jgi:small subunit ribosomal protein S8
MSIDTIGNFLTIIRNGVMITKSFVVTPYSRQIHDIAGILKDEGFIKDFEIVEGDSKKSLKIFLKYVDGESVIHNLTRISRPGLRAYTGIEQLKPVIGGLGVSILTTNKGILSHKHAEKLKVGGEIICTVW